MVRALPMLVAIAIASVVTVAPAPPPAFGATAPHKEAAASKRVAAKRDVPKRVVKRWRRSANYGPYGFLPGVRPPEVVDFESQLRAADRPYYALPWARFHRGRWNGGGFGPCYTYTPIGPIWNCGR